MVVVGLTDKELTPVPPETGVPPQLPVYQSVVSGELGAVTEIVEEPPTQIVEGLAAMPVGAAGVGYTVIEMAFVAVQPIGAEAVTVYVVDVVGEAVTVAPVVVFNPVDGVHEKVV